MSLVMKKYTYENKNYLVYDRNILDNKFSMEQWAFICSNSQGVGVDFVFDITNDALFIYDKYGEQIFLDEKIIEKISLHHRNINKCKEIAHDVEVRFTNYYIEKLLLLNYNKISYSA